jgi:hypothetical protein
MNASTLRLLGAAIAVGLVVAVVTATASATPPSVPWQTGMVAKGNTTIEPAVNDTDGSQVFLLTPNGSPFFQATQESPIPPPPFSNVSAPLYLVTYPLGSTADAGQPFNCYTEGFFQAGLPYNCDHAQIPGVKGHDHLVGVPGSQKLGGDYNVQWHVLATFFTPKGMGDGAMNVRIHTLDQLQAAQANGDVSGFVDTGIYFDCSAVSSGPYMASSAVPLNFSPGQP